MHPEFLWHAIFKVYRSVGMVPVEVKMCIQRFLNSHHSHKLFSLKHIWLMGKFGWKYSYPVVSAKVLKYSH